MLLHPDLERLERPVDHVAVEGTGNGSDGVLLRGAQKKSVDFAVWVLGSVHHHLGKPQPPLILLRNAQKKSVDFTVWVVLPRSAQNARKKFAGLERDRSRKKNRDSVRSECEKNSPDWNGTEAERNSDAGLLEWAREKNGRLGTVFLNGAGIAWLR